MNPRERVEADRVRFDRWLWSARLYKSRTQAAAAITGGKARIGGRRSKPGALVGVGDAIQVRKGPYDIELEVRGLAAKRGPARDAAALYEETAESREARDRVAAALRTQPVIVFHGKGRPTKRDRRRIERLADEWPD